MKSLSGFAFSAWLLLLVSGCFTTSAPVAKTWTVEAPPVNRERLRSMEGDGLVYSTTRLGSVTVDSPYDRPQIVVRKADGTTPLDYYNVFSAPPSMMLRAPASDRLQNDGRFGRVVQQSSVASADAQVEVRVKELSLDCREAGNRSARAQVCIDVVRTGRGPRTVTSAGEGGASADARDGDYARAFSEAFSQAFDAAVLDALGERGKK